MNVPTPIAVQTAPAHRVTSHELTRSAQRRAWICLLGAFSVWCFIIAGTVVGTINYRRSATESPTGSLQIDRGIVLYQDGPTSMQVRGQSGMELFEGGLVEANDATSATIGLFDGSRARLFPGARIQLTSLRTGVFNAELTRISLKQESGAVSYTVSGQLPFGRDVTVQTPHGLVSLTRGDVTIWIDEGETRVLSYDGRGKVESDARQVRFRDGQRVVASENALPREPLPIAENLIKNGDLSQGFAFWEPIDIRERGRTDVLGNRAVGQELIAGRRSSTLHVFRDTQKDSHNETGITQEINRDVTPYRIVNLSGWVKVNFASLSGGGYLGSEYPMMLRVQFTDDKGSRQVWSKGFFYSNPENRPTEIGEQITRGEWYPFLVRLHELPDRPVFVKSIEVLGSGHDFDASMSYLQLIAE